MKIVPPLVREIKKFQITYTQFLAVIFGLFNFVNLFLIPLGQFGVIPLTAESYTFTMLLLSVSAFMSGTLLHRVGALHQGTLQNFDLQIKELYRRQVNYHSCCFAEKMNMTPEELAQDKLYWEGVLHMNEKEL